jgi:hypothetical protein
MIYIPLAIQFSQIGNILLALGYLVGGIILIILLFRILTWIYKALNSGWATPLLGHRAYFYVYLRGPVFYSERFLRLLFFKLFRNKKWAIHSALVGYVKKPFYGTNDKNRTAEIFTKSFGQREPVAVAKFVHDTSNNIKKAEIYIRFYGADGSSGYEKNPPVGYVDVNGDIFQYYENYDNYKINNKLQKAVKIGSCCDILSDHDKEFETKGEDKDEDVLLYIKDDLNVQDLNSVATVTVSEEEGTKKEPSLPSSWFSFRINKAEERQVKATRFDATSRKGKGRFINVVPLSWDVKAMAFGYGYSRKNPNWGKPDNLNEIPLLYIGCAALLLLECQGFVRYEDEVIEDPSLGWAETVMSSLLIYLGFYYSLLKFSILKIIFPFIGPELSLIVMMILLFFGIWAIVHFTYNSVIGRPLWLKRILNMLNANVGTLGYSRWTILISTVGLILTIFYLPYTLFPFFLAVILALQINRKFFPQRRWELIDPFNNNDGGDGGDNAENETGDFEERKYDWNMQSAFRSASFKMELYFDPQVIQDIRNVNPFKNPVPNYAFTAKSMVVNELNARIDGLIGRAVFPQLSIVLSKFNKLASERKLTQIEKLNMILAFVQGAILYKADSDSQVLKDLGLEREYCRFSRETLYDQEGDCDCKSELASALFAKAGYRMAYAVTHNHAFVCFSANSLGGLVNYLQESFINIKGEQFLFCETTSEGWTIGKIPDNFDRNEIQEIEIIDFA